VKKKIVSNKSNKFVIALVLVVAVGAILATVNASNFVGNILNFQSSTYTCVDSDGGNVTGVRGNVTFIFSNGTQTVAGNDYCRNPFPIGITEYFCPSNPTQTFPSTYNGVCPSGTMCSNGACLPATCTDSDLSNNRSVMGVITIVNNTGTFTFNDRCSSTSSVFQLSCHSSATPAQYGSYYNVTVSNCLTGQVCSNGACVPITYTCRDTDGGTSSTIRGNVTITPSIGSPTSRLDSCANSTNVFELSCSSPTASTLTNASVRCGAGNGCSSGACVLVTYLCRDSDGSSISVAGNVTVTPSIGSPVVRSDYCVANGFGVNEYRCTSATASTATVRQYNCPVGTSCSSGRCS